MRKNMTAKEMTATALFTAAICLLAPFAVPVGPVSVTLATLVIYFSVYVLGTRRAVISTALYLLIGAIGLPVFSGFTGGAGRLLGPSGGYLIGYIPMVITAGLIMGKGRTSRLRGVLGLAGGTAVLYAFGTAWLAWSAGLDAGAALMAGVIPFIPGDALKIAAAAALSPGLLKLVEKSSP